MLSIKVKDALWRQKMCVECIYIYKSDFISILNPMVYIQVYYHVGVLQHILASRISATV